MGDKLIDFEVEDPLILWILSTEENQEGKAVLKESQHFSFVVRTLVLSPNDPFHQWELFLYKRDNDLMYPEISHHILSVGG